jgi:8-oxo-dGTP diphosphatase
MSKFVNSCTKFIGDCVGGLWKRLPYRLRLRIIRVTQKKFTASVGVIITNRNGKVLLLEHILRPGSGWGIPGGFIEHNEQPESAVRREIREETGIELENLKMFRLRTVNRHIEFLFRAESNDEPQVCSREIRSLGWFAIDEMPAEMPEPQKLLVEKVLKGEI